MTSPSVVVICPDEAHRRNLLRALSDERASIVREFTAYPSYSHILSLLDPTYDAVVVGIDTDIDVALDLIETICSHTPAATVLAYTGQADPQLLVRCMRAGARELLTHPLSAPLLGEALVRAAARHAAAVGEQKATGKLLLFWGSKGGNGVTTLASNFAIALRKESGAEVALLDLNPNLGDVAVLLGIAPKFTLTDALANPTRLDRHFVSTLLSEHGSGICVLAAPDTFRSAPAVETQTVRKLLQFVRDQFSYVVVDAGPALGSGAEALFQMATTIYLVAERDIPSLRNAQRLIAYAQQLGQTHVEVVLNRFDSRTADFDDERLAKALGLPPKWKVPNDYVSVHRSLNTGIPLILSDSSVSHSLHQMARAACGKAIEKGKRKGFRLFGF